MSRRKPPTLLADITLAAVLVILVLVLALLNGAFA
tara:strand:- start:37548 stop:37652 length:105 start_codon:yes stop_codon:yes gene_type:complete